MHRIMKATTFFVALTICAIATAPMMAQQSKGALPAPLPSQIVTGRKVFISNAGGDSHNLYDGGPDRLYNQFYSAIKNWGRYEFVGSPAEADLVFEIGFANPFVGESGYGGGGQTSFSGRGVTDPRFRLVILDPGTRVTLWVFTRHIEPAMLQGNRDKNFDLAVNFLVNNLQNVVAPPVASASTKK